LQHSSIAHPPLSNDILDKKETNYAIESKRVKFCFWQGVSCESINIYYKHTYLHRLARGHQSDLAQKCFVVVWKPSVNVSGAEMRMVRCQAQFCTIRNYAITFSLINKNQIHAQKRRADNRFYWKVMAPPAFRNHFLLSFKVPLCKLCSRREFFAFPTQVH